MGEDALGELPVDADPVQGIRLELLEAEELLHELLSLGYLGKVVTVAADHSAKKRMYLYKKKTVDN